MLDFNLDIGSIRIGLIPDFMGYILMIKGLTEIERFSEHFIKTKPFANGMLIFSIIIYVMDFLSISPILGTFINTVLGILSMILSLLIVYKIILGIKDIEDNMLIDLHSKQLYSTWKLLAFLSILVYILIFIPSFILLCVLMNLVVNIYFLYMFNKSKNQFYTMKNI